MTILNYHAQPEYAVPIREVSGVSEPKRSMRVPMVGHVDYAITINYQAISHPERDDAECALHGVGPFSLSLSESAVQCKRVKVEGGLVRALTSPPAALCPISVDQPATPHSLICVFRTPIKHFEQGFDAKAETRLPDDMAS